MKLLLFLVLFSCNVEAKPNTDAGIPNNTIYIQNKVKWIYSTYFRPCVRLCFKYSYSDSCPQKCQQDFVIITKVAIKAINDNKEADIEWMLDSWYLQE